MISCAPSAFAAFLLSLPAMMRKLRKVCWPLSFSGKRAVFVGLQPTASIVQPTLRGEEDAREVAYKFGGRKDCWSTMCVAGQCKSIYWMPGAAECRRSLVPESEWKLVLLYLRYSTYSPLPAEQPENLPLLGIVICYHVLHIILKLRISKKVM